jgi:hypothetical protein
MRFIDNQHFFDWCQLFEGIWRARVKANPKTAQAERSLAKFHAQQPDHVNLAQWRLNRARRRAA